MNVTKYPLKLILQKKGQMIYFSQQDIFHVLERALRRSGLPLYYTCGFNPHVKISFMNGLKLGLEGDIEVILYFTEDLSHKQIKKALSKQLPEGLDICSNDGQ